MKITEDILDIEEKVALAFSGKNFSGTDKFRHVKYAILEALKGAIQDTRFPPIRNLSKRLGIGTIPVQKAVLELIAENRLYSRERVGLFVKNPPDEIMIPQESQIRKLSIYCNENSDEIQRLMLQSLNCIRREYKGFDVELFFEKQQNPDMYIQFSGDNILNLKETSAGIYTDKKLVLCGDCTAPLINQVHYFLWNKKLLDKHHFSAPCYQDFKSQAAYFKQMKNVFEIPVLSVVLPDTLCVTEVTSFIRAHEGDNRSTGAERLENALSSVWDFCSSLRFAVHQNEHELFFQGLRPGIILATNQMNEICRNARNLSLGVYPIFDYSDNFVFTPITMQLADRLETFYQGCQLLYFLQSEEVQKLFMSHGFASIYGKGLHLPDSGGGADLKASFVFEENPFLKYIWYTVIRSEALKTAIYRHDRKSALQNIMAYTHTIFNHFRRK